MAKNRDHAGAKSRSFAHLLGIGPKAGKRAEDETKPPKDDEKPDAARVEQEPDTEDDGKTQCGICDGTGTDEDGDKCEACDGTGEVGQGDDDVVDPKKPEDALPGDDGEAKGRKAERTRWTRVLAHKAAGGTRVAAACSMLSTTDMKASAIVAALENFGDAAPQMTRGETLYSRMNGDSRPPNPGSAAAQAGSQTLADRVKAAVALVRPN